MNTRITMKVSPVHRCLPPGFQKDLDAWFFRTLSLYRNDCLSAQAIEYPVREKAALEYGEHICENSYIYMIDTKVILNVAIGPCRNAAEFLKSTQNCRIVLGEGSLRFELENENPHDFYCQFRQNSFTE